MSHSESIQDTLPAWMPTLQKQGGPRFLQVADALQQAVESGALKSGDRLPPQRWLAATLQVDLTTITRAYDEARRRHLLEGRGARGTYVAAPKAELTPVLDLSMNTPPPPAGVDADALLKQGLAQVLMGADNTLLMNYHLAGGSDADREAAARWLAPAFGRLDKQQLVVCPGAQAAIAALILTLTKPGDMILAEPLCYPGLHTAARQLGRRVQAVGTDEHGMLPELLEQACQQYHAPLLYLNPTLQNPTALTMPEVRRSAIATVIQQYRLRVIEDDPYWLLAETAPPPFATRVPEQVAYISTLSKCLMPGLRVAFVLIRDANQREHFLSALRSFALMTAPVMAALATQWIQDGSAQQILKGVRKEARLRHNMASNILAGRDAGCRDALHIWLTLPAYWEAAQLARAAAEEGIFVTPAEDFRTGDSQVNAIRLSLGSTKERQHLQTGLQKLSRLLASPPDHIKKNI